MQDPVHILSQFSAYGFSSIAHLSQSFDQHLLGVYQVLKSWEEEEAVCVAGLLHSIYGTVAFRHEIVSLQERDWVRSVVGERAEALVFLFCVHARVSLFSQLQNDGEYYVESFQDNRRMPVTSEQFRDLIVLNFANIIELRPRTIGQDRDAFKEYLKPARKILSPTLASRISAAYQI